MLGRLSLGLVAAVVLAASGCGSSSSNQVSQQQKIQQVKNGIARLQRYVAQRESAQDGGPHRGGSGYRPAPHTGPAKMFGRGQCDLAPPEVFWPEVNGWTVTSHRHTTVVCAGAAGQGTRLRSTGRFLIVRENMRAKQTLDRVDVAGSGPLKITKAPLGSKVVRWAQRRGNLEFTSRRGVTGTLHLEDDTVTLDQ